MLTLLLLRHAKAENSRPDLADHDRGLTGKGLADARRLGRSLRNGAFVPDAVLTSSARRAQQTASGLIEAGDLSADLQISPSLYDASPDAIASMIAATTSTIRSLMLVGHNPAFAEVAGLLAKSGDEEDRARLRQHFPPCALAVLRLDLNRWDDIRLTSDGCLEALITPDTLP